MIIVVFSSFNIQVHGDYSEDVGVKVDRPADEPIPEATEVIGAWMRVYLMFNLFIFFYI